MLLSTCLESLYLRPMNDITPDRLHERDHDTCTTFHPASVGIRADDSMETIHAANRHLRIRLRLPRHWPYFRDLVDPISSTGSKAIVLNGSCQSPSSTNFVRHFSILASTLSYQFRTKVKGFYNLSDEDVNVHEFVIVNEDGELSTTDYKEEVSASTPSLLPRTSTVYQNRNGIKEVALGVAKEFSDLLEHARTTSYSDDSTKATVGYPQPEFTFGFIGRISPNAITLLF